MLIRKNCVNCKRQKEEKCKLDKYRQMKTRHNCPETHYKNTNNLVANNSQRNSKLMSKMSIKNANGNGGIILNQEQINQSIT